MDSQIYELGIQRWLCPDVLCSPCLYKGVQILISPMLIEVKITFKTRQYLRLSEPFVNTMYIQFGTSFCYVASTCRVIYRRQS